MADMEKSPAVSPDPEKVAELTRNTTCGTGEITDALYIHADPNDGDEAYVLSLALQVIY
jgi:ACS family allantoate permease-like MFS transporter